MSELIRLKPMGLIPIPTNEDRQHTQQLYENHRRTNELNGMLVKNLSNHGVVVGDINIIIMCQKQKLISIGPNKPFIANKSCIHNIYTKTKLPGGSKSSQIM